LSRDDLEDVAGVKKIEPLGSDPLLKKNELITRKKDLKSMLKVILLVKARYDFA